VELVDSGKAWEQQGNWGAGPLGYMLGACGEGGAGLGLLSDKGVGLSRRACRQLGRLDVSSRAQHHKALACSPSSYSSTFYANNKGTNTCARAHTPSIRACALSRCLLSLSQKWYAPSDPAVANVPYTGLKVIEFTA